MQFQALDTRRVPAWRRHDEWTDDDPVALGREGQVSDAMPSPGRRLRGVESVKGTQQDQIGWALPARDGVLAVAESRGASQVFRVTGAGAELLLDSDAGVLIFGCGTVGARPAADSPIMVTYRTSVGMDEVGLLEAGTVRPLTDFSAALRSLT